MPFDPQAYGSTASELLKNAPCNELGPGTPDEGRRAALERLIPERLMAPHAAQDRTMAMSCLAGLWLRYDFLDESHQISQDIAGPTGSYWHGIMHRREGDFGNAKYWFQRVGRHPIFDELAREAGRLAGETHGPADAEYLSAASTWDPMRFVDLCEQAIRTEVPLETLCMKIQQREWELLFDYCYREARGRTS
jgi:hypothetical protein